MTHTPLEHQNADLVLREIIINLIEKQPGWTDLLVAPDNSVRFRLGSQAWKVAKDANDQEIVVTRSMADAFLNGIYEHEEMPYLQNADKSRRTPDWTIQLGEMGALHPATTIAERRNGEIVGKHRVRCTVLRQLMGSSYSMAIRHLKRPPASPVELGLPVQFQKMCMARHGMILVTGPTGAGKTTTLAAAVNEINATTTSNILTIEDPVEYVHEWNKSVVTQREVGLDVPTFVQGVEDAWRFVPDVIVIGEIRDAGTMRAAVRAAGSGHLVYATAHAPTPVAAIRSLLAYLEGPTDAMAFANSLVGIVSQALVLGREEGKKHLVCEILDARSTGVRDAISSGDFKKLSAIESSLRQGQLEGGGSVSMMKGIQELLAEEKADVEALASLAQTQDEFDRIMAMRARPPRPGGRNGGFGVPGK